MNKYKVQVCMTYVQVIEVEAEDMHDAEQRAFEQFDLSKANQGEGDAWVLETQGENLDEENYHIEIDDISHINEQTSWLDVPLEGFGNIQGEMK